MLGVLDTRLAPLASDHRLDWLGACLTRHGVGGVRVQLESKTIPTQGSAVIPMPYLVERSVVELCGAPPRAAD